MGRKAHFSVHWMWFGLAVVAADSSWSQTSPTFVDVGAAAGLDAEGQHHCVAVGDYDGDGDEDIYVGTKFQPNSLYRNNGDMTFTNVEEAGVADEGFTNAAIWFDFNDGDSTSHGQRLEEATPRPTGSTSTKGMALSSTWRRRTLNSIDAELARGGLQPRRLHRPVRGQHQRREPFLPQRRRDGLHQRLWRHGHLRHGRRHSIFDYDNDGAKTCTRPTTPTKPTSTATKGTARF